MLVFQLKIFTLEFLVSPGSRHVGEGDIVVSNAAKARQDLGERCHDKVLAMPANGVLIDVDSILYLYWERGRRVGGGVVS